MVKLTQELQLQRDKLERQIQNSSKIEYLYSIDEFNYLLEFIRKWRDELASTILNGKILNDVGSEQHRKEDFNKGGWHYLNKIIELDKTFKLNSDAARKKLEKLDKDIRESVNDL